MLYKDGYMHQHFKLEMFRNWVFDEPFNIDLKQYLKSLNECKTVEKIRVYETAILTVE